MDIYCCRLDAYHGRHPDINRQYELVSGRFLGEDGKNYITKRFVKNSAVTYADFCVNRFRRLCWREYL